METDIETRKTWIDQNNTQYLQFKTIVGIEFSKKLSS